MTIEITIHNIATKTSMIIENATLQDLIEARKNAKTVANWPNTWVEILFYKWTKQEGYVYWCEETYYGSDDMIGYYNSFITGILVVDTWD